MIKQNLIRIQTYDFLQTKLSFLKAFISPRSTAKKPEILEKPVV